MCHPFIFFYCSDSQVYRKVVGMGKQQTVSQGNHFVEHSLKALNIICGLVLGFECIVTLSYF